MALEGKETVNDSMISYFFSLTEDERSCLLNQLLIQQEPVIVYPSFHFLGMNTHLKYGMQLLKGLALCKGDSKLLRDARERFYGGNEFLVWWHGLGDFLSGVSTDAIENCPVDRIVRNVTVRYDMGEDKKYWLGKDLVTELERLLCLENPKRLSIEIIGEGNLDGSDIKTQQLLKDACFIVNQLKAHFGARFEIRKGSRDSTLLPSRHVYPLTSYWDEPDDLMRQKVRIGVANNEENMRVQVESWLHEKRTIAEGTKEPTEDQGMVEPWESDDAIEAILGSPENWLDQWLFLPSILPQESLELEALF
ncbi:hypothetical protein THAR02_09858 [Trichoderma harzianum]|uniref:Uncharacterized protein n=1 Tax=Trichoderma harzianum TaxID=5544 RepID=A0A0F9ZC66_TRIHA|nr:hypothetical protein N5P37_005648 [Trichoderma harzianum]KKO98041.1 hypothetical protein THAR02_09858 [Trichoderma harzianum]